MALSRKLLESMGLDEKQVASIIESHIDTVDALKAERDKYKADAEKLPGIQKQLNDTTKELNDLKEAGGDWQTKYEKEHKDFEDYKTDIQNKQIRAGKESAYKALLAELGLKDKLAETILKGVDLDKVVLKDGKIEDSEKLTETLKEEWKDYIPEGGTGGAPTSHPAGGTDGKPDYEKMSMAEYIAARNKK